MGYPTATRERIRRTMCRRLGMRFFRMVGSSSVTTDVSGVTIIDTAKLHQRDDFWNNAWLYVIDGTAAGSFALISGFDKENSALTLEVAITGFATGDAYQILDVYSPPDIHDGMNDAIIEGSPAFSDVVEDESLVLQEDTVGYDLSNFTNAPHYIHKIWFENGNNPQRGLVVSATNTTAVLPSGVDISSGNTNWFISIYDGTGKGQLRSFASVDGQEVTVTAWDTNPDATSKFCVWDGSDEYSRWISTRYARFDRQENPGTLYLTERPVDLYGMRIRVQISVAPSELSADADTTVVPLEFIVRQAISSLHATSMNDNRFERSRHSQLANEFRQLAIEYKNNNSFDPPSTTLWNSPEGDYGIRSSDNPFGW